MIDKILKDIKGLFKVQDKAKLFAIGLQGLFLMVCLGIYAVLVKTIQITDIHTSTFTILGYAVLLGLMMLKSGTLAKSVLNAH